MRGVNSRSLLYAKGKVRAMVREISWTCVRLGKNVLHRSSYRASCLHTASFNQKALLQIGMQALPVWVLQKKIADFHNNEIFFCLVGTACFSPIRERNGFFDARESGVRDEARKSTIPTRIPNRFAKLSVMESPQGPKFELLSPSPNAKTPHPYPKK